MTLRVGTSGFSYKEWKGSFYPKDLSAKKMLQFYASHFSTCEINNTFYKMPKREVLAAWREQVPKTFTFVLKASQGITHFKRLLNAGEAVTDFFKAADVLDDQLGHVLFQLPPNMKKDKDRLKTFLRVLPRGQKVAFEFRNPTWFDEEIYDLLRRKKATLCVDQSDEFDCPLVSTAPVGYFRLRRKAYKPKEIKTWAETIRAFPVEESFVFFKHEDLGTGPKFARALHTAFKNDA